MLPFSHDADEASMTLAPLIANRIERLLLLLLQKLGTSTEAIDVAWQEPSDQTTDQPASVGKVDQ